MTFNRVSIACLLLCLTALVSSADAQNSATPAAAGYLGDSVGFATAGDFSGSYLFGNDGGTYFLFDKMVGDGPGYGAGYSRLGMRVKLHDFGDSHLWGSGYALITDEMRVGVNLGGGVRWLHDSNIISLHGWWDSYETDNGHRYDQIAAGFELLHEEVDFRVNGYLPLNETENFLGVTDPGTVSVFTSRGIGFLGRGLDEQALKGIDAEVGTAIFGVNWARIYGGGYWYEGKNTSFGGARGRIETAISPDLSLNFMVQNDTEFNTNYNLSVEYRFSGGLSPGFFTPFHGEARKYNPVRRQWPIATQVVEIDTVVPMLNPKTGGLMTAAFVDNRNATAGDGSFNNPFRELPDSVDADKIFVFAGTGQTTGNITLRAEQQLLGEGKLYTFEDPLRGTVTVPSVFSSSGPRPELVATDNMRNVITLSDWNRVANFDITGPAAAGIGGMNIRGFEIDMVTGTGLTDGLYIVNASGVGRVNMSGFEVSDEGVVITNTSGDPLNLTMTDVVTTGGREGIRVGADGADVNLLMSGAIADRASDVGISLDASLGGQMVADVDVARVLNTGMATGDGFNLNVSSGGSMMARMTDISARGQGDLFVVDAQNGHFVGSVSGGVPGILAGADFSDSATGSGVRLNLVNATGQLRFDNLVANRNAVKGIESRAIGGATDFYLEVLDSRLLANIGDGTMDHVSGGARFRKFVDPTFITNSGGNGMEFVVLGAGTQYIADIVQTDFSESGLHAIRGTVLDGATANVDLIQVAGQLAGLNGLDLTVGRNASFTGTASDVFFNGAGGAAVDLRAIDNASLSLTMDNVQGQQNGDVGLRYLVDDGPNGGSNLFLAVTDADFNSNPNSNVVGTSRGPGSVASIFLNQVTADGAAANGAVQLTASEGGVLNQTWRGGSISQGDNGGVIAMVDGAGSQMRMNFDSVLIQTNTGGDGIDATLTNGGAGSLLDIGLVNSSVSQNALNGIDLSISGAGATSRVTIDNTPIVSNFAGDGFEFDVLGGAQLVAQAFGMNTSFVANGARAWDGKVSGPGSTATVMFDGTDAVGLGFEAGRFNVDNGGQLNLNLANLLIAENGLDGLLTIADGAGSQANLTLDQVTMRRNGLSLVGDAFDARATNGGRVDALLTNMNVTESREDAFRFDAATGGVIQARLDNVIAENNGRHGLEFHAASGGQFNGTVTDTSFSNNGLVFEGDGVFGMARDAGTLATAMLRGVAANNGSRHGFEFQARSGATLLADIRSGGFFGTSSASNNMLNGVRFDATGAGTMALLKMMGPNEFNSNGLGGVDFDAVGVDMAVANVTGSANDNGGDGINVRMVNVTTGAIALNGEGTGTIMGNTGDGVDVTTQNVNLVDKTVNGMLIPDFQVEGFDMSGNGGNPIVVNMTATDVQTGEITNNTTDGGQDGISVTLGTGTSNMTIDGNSVSNAVRYGISVNSDTGMHQVDVTNNTVISSGDTNIFADIAGTSQTGLMINDNTVIGGGTGQAMFTTGLNFTGSTSPESGFIPPDTMGSVGPNHIVEFINGVYAVYDKTTGTELFQSSLDQFFVDAGLPQGPGGVRFDPRIIYDPTVDRWFASSIDGGAGNLIYVAVSITDNPLDGFRGVSFVGDSIDSARFNDFDTMGIDANGVYLATNNFGGPTGFDVSFYSIPKADLLGPNPTVANLSRFENLDASVFGDTPQAAIDFGPAEPVTEFLSTNGFVGSTNLFLTNLMGTDTPNATIGTPQSVAVPPYTAAPNARQPAAPPLENVTPRFNGNIVEVNDSLWAVHAITGSTGNSALRWYEIDSSSGTVLQTGLIEDPNVDYLDGSIAVNPSGAVVIGFTGSGPTQNPSSMAVFGSTDAGGVTTFQTPQILQVGNTSYFEDFGSGRNRWGDYSATVVDPTDPDRFWTFQEYAVGPSTWGIQITEINFTQQIFGGTVNDGIHVDVRETARLLPSTINGNEVSFHGDDAIDVVIADTAVVDSLDISGNVIDNNGDVGVSFQTANPGTTIGALTINGNTLDDNVGTGVDVDLDSLSGAMVPDVVVSGNVIRNGMDDGINVDIQNTHLDDVVVSMNTVEGNSGGGILVNAENLTAGVINADAFALDMNLVNNNGSDGMLLTLNNLSSVQVVSIQGSTVTNNMGRGVVFSADDTPVVDVMIADNTINGNMDDDALLISLTDSPTDTLTLLRNQLGGAPNNAVQIDLLRSTVADLQIRDNMIGMVAGMGGGSSLDDSLPVIRNGFNANTLPANDDGSTASVGIGFPINFFGQTFNNTFVNNNGNITFTGPLSAFTPFNLLSTQTPIIAPFFADVDTRAGNVVTYGNGTIAGQTAFGVNWPGVRHFSINGTNMGLPENIFQLVLVDRSDIASGDFDVEFNYEQILWEAGTASGANEMGLGGSSARAGLSNGTNFALELPGSAINGAFLDSGPAATSLIQNNMNSTRDGRYVFFFRGGGLGMSSPSGGDGIQLSAMEGSDIGSLAITGNLIEGNGAHGVEVLVSDSTLPTDGLVANNEITNHDNGDGFRIVNPDTNNTDFGLDFIDNDISSNGSMVNGVGIHVQLDADSGSMSSTVTGNTISDNGSIGTSFVLQDDADLNLTFGDTAASTNMVTGNVDAGIAITTEDTSTATIVVENTQVTGTTNGMNAAFDGDGLAVHSSGQSIVRSLTVGDDTSSNTTFSNNTGNGIDLEVSENARNPNVLIQNAVANNNSVHGIGLTRTGFSTFTEDLDSDGTLDLGEDVNSDGMLGNAVITSTTANNNGGNGLDVSISGSQLPVQQIDVMLNQNSFNSNTIGMNFTVSNDANLLVNAANNVVNGNASHGIQVTTNQSAAFGNVIPSLGDPNSPQAVPSTFSSNVITNNGGNGLNFVANDDSIQVIDVNDAGAVNPSTGTSRTVIDGNAGNQVQITGNDDSQQNIDLAGVEITNTGGVATGDGVSIDANNMSTVDVSVTAGVTGRSVIGSLSPLAGMNGLNNGIAAMVSGDAILNLDVSDVDLFNNSGDAVNIRNNGPTVTGNQAGGSGQRQTIQATFDNIDARLSGDQGFDVVLTGNVGGRPIAQGDTDMPVLIEIMNSNFSSNTNEGVFFRAQPGFTHGGNNLYADLIAEFNVLNSVIQANGSTTITDGLVMEIGTNAYVLSEISGNMFGANGLDDFHTNAFDSGANANTAQLDLAFQNNSGDHIRPTAFGATTGSALFILDNGLTVEPNNDFQMFGVPQQEVFGPDGFDTNGYMLRPMSNHGDPTFP